MSRSNSNWGNCTIYMWRQCQGHPALTSTFCLSTGISWSSSSMVLFLAVKSTSSFAKASLVLSSSRTSDCNMAVQTFNFLQYSYYKHSWPWLTVLFQLKLNMMRHLIQCSLIRHPKTLSSHIYPYHTYKSLMLKWGHHKNIINEFRVFSVKIGWETLT